MSLTKEKLISKTLEKEGGYCNIAGDSGGMTYKGIAYNYNKTWAGWPIVKKHLPLKTNAVIKDANLDALVIKFYEGKFYTPCKCEEITSPIVKAHLYDMAVNAGIKSSVKILQKAINMTYNVQIAVDGMIGPTTIKYANTASKINELENNILTCRKNYYKSIGTGSRAKFLKGWISRADDISNWAKQFK